MAEDPPGQGAGVLAVADDGDPVDEDVLDPGGVLVGIAEGGPGGDHRGVEDHEVGERALPDRPAVAQAERAAGRPVILCTASAQVRWLSSRT